MSGSSPTSCIVWNISDPLLEDARVRRALAMAFDRQTVIDKLYHGQARAVSGPFTPDQRENNPEVSPIDFNPTAATGLLASAGWRDTDGDGCSIAKARSSSSRCSSSPAAPPSRDQSQIFQDALARIGVQAGDQPAR